MAVLFTVTTPHARLVWSGPAADVQDARETIRTWGSATLDAEGATEAPLRLDEETTYTVWLESLDGSPVQLRHADPIVTAGLAQARSGTIVYGPVRFGSQAGRSRFAILVDGRTEATVEVTVAPVKMAWADLDAMRVRVDGAAAGLPLAALRAADAVATPDAGRASAPAFLALLRDATPRLDRALREIARDPETVVARPLVSVLPHTLRRASSETIRAVHGAAVWPERVPGRPARPSLDTPAHRWLAARLATVRHRADALRRAEAARPSSPRRGAIVTELERTVRTLDAARRLAPFTDAGRASSSSPPLSLRARPAYAAADDALRALRGALRLGAGEIGVPVQDLSALYETWAALETVEAFARAVGAEVPPFGVRTVGADVRLGRGRQHAVHLRGERAEVEVVRQPRFGGPPALLVQIPDLLVTVRRAGEAPRRVVLDAKYRVDARTEAPPGEALGALHRYRDAIVGPDGRPLVGTAAVLFPARPGDGFAASRVWTSLAAIGVGAVPLLPGATGWLDRFARAVVRGEPF